MMRTLESETQLAEAARAWRDGLRENAEPQRLERRLADALELWIAALLATDERWPLRGRWFDGLVFEECRAEPDGRLLLAGYVWSIDQKQHPFRAIIDLSASGVRAFNVDVASAEQQASKRGETKWTVHFADSR